MGRFAEPALWVVVALGRGPRTLTGLLDDVRHLDGAVGHGTLLGTIARLEAQGIIEPTLGESARRAWRLSARTSEWLP